MLSTLPRGWRHTTAALTFANRWAVAGWKSHDYRWPKVKSVAAIDGAKLRYGFEDRARRHKVIAMIADPNVVATWIYGWSLARETALPIPFEDGFRTDVGWPQQKARYVFASLSPAIGELARAVEEPWVFLKACVPAEAVQSMLPARWVIQRPGFMMTCTDLMLGDGRLPEGYAIEVSRGSISVVAVRASTRAVAAIGRVVVVDDFAIYDRIETCPQHRRRGVARATMKALEAIGRENGATRGVLVATPDGRAVYEKLGWKLHAPYTSTVILGD